MVTMRATLALLQFSLVACGRSGPAFPVPPPGWC